MKVLKPFFSILLIFGTWVLFTGCQQQKQGPTPADTIIGKHYDSSWTDDMDYTTNTTPQGYRQSNDADVVIPVEGDSWGAEVVYDGGADGSLVTRDPSLTDMSAMNSLDSSTPLVSIYFGFDQFAVAESERPKLLRALQYLQNNPGAKLIAEGHTDWRGTNEYNLALGDRRANSVRSYLINSGAQAEIAVSSKGELEATEDVEKNDPIAIQDRRVDVYVFN
jgi:peptidoglycan-associated lipoprotein